MVGLLLTVSALGALVWRGMNRAVAPTRSEDADRKRLAMLKNKRRLTLDEAEDGLVLARRFKDDGASRTFTPVASKLRGRRVAV